jgi:hypothetical protein
MGSVHAMAGRQEPPYLPARMASLIRAVQDEEIFAQRKLADQLQNVKRQ